MKTNSRGFTVVELAIALGVAALLVTGIAVTEYLKNTDRAKAKLCSHNREQIVRAEANYVTDKGVPSVGMEDLVSEGYLRYMPDCPSKGVYSWLTPAHETVVCSVHGVLGLPTELTSLGSTFDEITSGMTALISEFYKKYGRYPRSWGDYVYTDIGLDPEEWAESYDGIFYAPGGNRVSVKPDTGYSITVTGSDGKTRVLTPKLKWSILYDMKTAAWYYHTITPSQKIDISTMTVEKTG